MPIYTYRCNQCTHQFDIRQRMSEDPLSVCPNCEGEIRRVVTSVGVVFKGSGFYVTDNRNGSSSQTSKKETSDTKTASKSSSEAPKGEAKTKPKKEAKSAA